MTTTIKITVTAEQLTALRKAAARTGLTLAGYLRQAALLHADSHGQKQVS